jgi:hypothetical protein
MVLFFLKCLILDNMACCYHLLQQYTGIRTVFANNASNEEMINGIASCLVFLFMYLQVFGLGKELLAGSFGASAASLGTSIGTGLAGKNTWPKVYLAA